MTNDLSDPVKFHEKLAQLATDTEETVETAENEESTEELPEQQGDAQEPEQKEEPREEHQEETDDDYVEEKLGTVPKGRFFAQVKRKKELEESLNAERMEKAALAQKLQSYEQALQQYFEQNQQEPESITPLDEESHNVLSKKDQELENKIKNLEQYQASIAMQNDLAIQQRDFEKKAPDFVDAYKHVVEVKIKEASQMIPGITRQQAETIAFRSLKQGAEVAWRNGQNVANIVYDLAQTYGYKPKNKQPDLQALQKNIKKSQSINTIPSAPVANEAAGVYLQKDGLKKIADKTGRIDPAKFHEILKKVQAGG